MSTYVTRVIEVKLPCVKGYVWNEESLNKIDKKTLLPYDVYRVNSDNEYPYRKFHIAHEIDGIPEYWEKMKTCDYKWHLVKYWVLNNPHSHADKFEIISNNNGKQEKVKKISEYCDNGGSIRDVYLSRWYEDTYNIINRGIPEDCSEETRKELCLDDKYIYNRTYVLLSELYSIYNREIENFKNKIKTTILNDQLKTIDKKIDKIYSKLNGEDAEPEVESDMEPEPEVNEMSDYTDYDTEGYDYEENIDSLFDEPFNDIQTLNDEIVIIHRLVDEIYGYISSENIRINYYFS